MQQKAGVKDGHTTKSESSFGKKLWCVIIVLFLGGIGWQMWKLNAYNNAVREAKEAGFEWTCDDTFSLIRQDWHNALKKETWGAHHRILTMRDVHYLGRYREMLHRLRPTVLRAYRYSYENVDELKGLTSLQFLRLYNCPVLQNVDGLKGLTGLQAFILSDCPALQNVDGIKSLTGLKLIEIESCPALLNVNGLEGHDCLKNLCISDCPALQNVDVLKCLTHLQWLDIQGCTALQNVDGLKMLTGLQTLNLNEYPALQNVDILKGLTSLRSLYFIGDEENHAAALLELHAALPKTDIQFCVGIGHSTD